MNRLANLCQLIITLVTCSIVSMVSAAPVTFGFTGAVTRVDPALSTQFAVGNSVQGSYTFDSTAADTNPSDQIGGYVDVFIGASIMFSSGYNAQYSGVGAEQILVDKGVLILGLDIYDVLVPVNGPPVGGKTPDQMRVLLSDEQANMLASDDLPITPPNRGLVENADGFVGFGPQNSRSFVEYSILTLTLIPEPSTVVLAAGLAGAMLFARFRRRCT